MAPRSRQRAEDAHLRISSLALRERWNSFWFRPAAPHSMIAARIIVALQALWLVLSRPMLPDVVRWPAPFWNGVNAAWRLRYLIGPFPFALEMSLYVVLAACLVCVLCGVMTRPAAFFAAILIYHFAPFEDVFASSGGPFFRGFTLPLFALLILAFARQPRRGVAPDSEYRWPLALMQLLFALTYLLSGISKLRIAGWRWATGDTFEAIVMSMSIPGSVPPWARYFVGNPLLCAAGGLAGFTMDFLFLTAVFSRRAARLIVPLTALAHLVIVNVLGVVFLGLPSLLLFVNWEWVMRRRSGVHATANGIAAETQR